MKGVVRAGLVLINNGMTVEKGTTAALLLLLVGRLHFLNDAVGPFYHLRQLLLKLCFFFSVSNRHSLALGGQLKITKKYSITGFRPFSLHQILFDQAFQRLSGFRDSRGVFFGSGFGILMNLHRKRVQVMSAVLDFVHRIENRAFYSKVPWLGSWH